MDGVSYCKSALCNTSSGIGTDEVGIQLQCLYLQSWSINTRLAGVTTLLVRTYDRSALLGLDFVTPSPGLIGPGIRQTAWTLLSVIYSLQR